MKFTDKFIANLKPEEKQYVKREGNGFAVRVLSSGQKTWLYIYTFDGIRRQMNLGSYPEKGLADARRDHAEAFAALNDKMNPRDPQAERDQRHENERKARTERKLTPTVADFIVEYIEKFAKKHNRGWKEIERALNAEILPRWGKRKITDIKRRDLVVLLDEIEERAPIMANRTLAYTRKMFSYAVKRDVLEANPFMGMEAPAPAKVRERNLSFDEIKALWENLDTARISDSIRRALKLILVTGQRPGEVIGMHTREIEGRWWTIPEERSKNKQAHRVYLTDMALSLIGDIEGKGFIFESPVPGKDAAGQAVIPRAYEVRTMTICIKENLPHTPNSTVVDRLKIQHFVPHDLRRTATSRMAEIGIFEDTIDRVQNHVSRVKSGVRKNYNHYAYDKEKQAALETWERKLVSIITGETSGKVVSIQKGKKNVA
jgi:integrase